MTFAFFAGRSSLRKLHHTVQRNINRQHKRNVQHETSKSNEPPSTSKSKSRNEVPSKAFFTGSYWAWIEPIKIPFRGYENMQQRSPLMTQFESSLIIYFLGDLAAQTMQTNVYIDGRYEPIRGVRALVIGGISSIPSYKWFLFLGRHFNYASHIKSLAVKITVNQMCFTPVFNTYFFGMQTLLAGGSWAEAKERVVNTVPRSFVSSWKVWPVITAFSFTFIRPQNRSVFAGVFAVFWQTYLSWLNRTAEAAEKEKQKILYQAGGQEVQQQVFVEKDKKKKMKKKPKAEKKETDITKE
ncbi:unnamed protein product [Zymoseptoria tritici ST99CH_3D7]|uniref:Uncharacterized protein n=1 Tax=Zymoseptoria tritici (strain ST99CH_3D7) TaxID=1276538 RepID=A0A1X7RW16_ZYMT9|nr:unnamed protein product [Zymoseptoria tritici ST99CH_3D7]